VVLWTGFGTLGCTFASILLDSLTFGDMDQSQRLRSIISDIVITLLVAAPFIFFFASKLRELAIAHHKLAILASTDSLTEVLSRGAFTTLVDAYLGDVRMQQESGALLVVDVDHFKRINDSFGHDRGDEALRLVAATIRGAIRSVDLVGRMGGEEFGVFLPGASHNRAEMAAERIRKAISETDFLPDGVKRELSVSVGGATFDRQVPFMTLYRAADQRLYAAKQSGRNRVAMAAIGEAVQAAA
jgi:diguanylate cyclase (GGDEF)-like protein